MTRTCDLTTSASHLQRSVRTLKDRWLETKQHWTDANAQEFERACLQPLVPRINALTAALYEFSEALAAAEKECGEEHEFF